MTDEDFKKFVQALAFGVFGTDKLTYYALSEDEIAIYLARPRHQSPGVLVLHRNGTWRHDLNLPADPMLEAKRHL